MQTLTGLRASWCVRGEGHIEHIEPRHWECHPRGGDGGKETWDLRAERIRESFCERLRTFANWKITPAKGKNPLRRFIYIFLLLHQGKPGPDIFWVIFQLITARLSQRSGCAYTLSWESHRVLHPFSISIHHFFKQPALLQVEVLAWCRSQC